MAGSKRARTLCRPGAVALVVAGLVGFSPGTSVAAPAAPPGSSPSLADVQREVTALGRQLDAVSEQYNRATLRLDKARQAQRTTDAARRKVDARLGRDTGRMRTVADSAYRAGPLSTMAAMVSSGSPQELLDRMSLLDTLSQRRHRIIDTLAADRDRAADAARAADRAAADAQRVTRDLAAKKAWITERLPRQQALLDRLRAAQQAQRARARAQQADTDAAPDDRASRGAQRAPVVDAPASSKAAIAVAAAKSKLGSPYVWAAAGPDTFDCSGLMMWAWAQAGVSLPHYSGDQYNSGTHVSQSELRPGDLVFFYQPISHVGMYIGGGQIIHAPQPGDVVKISSLDSFPYSGATRVG